MTTGTPSAYAYAAAIQQGLTFSTFGICFAIFANDGVSMSTQFDLSFIYDTTQTPSVNIAAAKAFIAANLPPGFTVSASNIILIMAVN